MSSEERLHRPEAGVKKPVTWPMSLMAVSVTEAAPAMVVKVAWLWGMSYTKPWASPAESTSKPTATSESLTPSSWVTAGLAGAGAPGQGHNHLGEAAPVV